MTQWTIIGYASASKVLGVIEAETKEDAIKIAENDDTINDEYYMSLCHYCSNEIEIGDIYEIDAFDLDEI